MKKTALTLLLCTLCTLAAAQNTALLAKSVDELRKDATLKHGTLSVSVYNINTKKAVYAYNAQQKMIPASLTKLFTTAAGFERLGSDFRFKTTLAYDGEIDRNGTLQGNIYIIGGGDPLLGSYRYRQTVPDTLFATWQRAMMAAGIRAVSGRILYDGSIFDNHPLCDSWEWGDIGNYYGSGVWGLNFHENMFFIHFTPGARVGYPAALSRVEPQGLPMRFVNEVTTGAARSGDGVIVYGDPTSTIRTCTGTMPLDGKNFSVRAALPKPGQMCADLFTAYLRAHKLSVSGAASECFQRPKGLVNLLEYTSPTYYIIAQYTNLTSNNTYAEAIHRYLGYKQYGLGSNANGCRAVTEFIQKRGVEASGCVLNDGCGLSVRNRITGDFLCRFLLEMTRSTHFDDFYRSLALAGNDGTVKNMLTGLPANIIVRIKTGSMSGVRGYAGYITTAKGERYCFSIIANDFDCSGSQMRSKLEKIIMKIATLE